MNKKRKQDGFTIMEILIAIVILVVGLVGIMALFPTAIDSGAKTVRDTYAAEIAKSVMGALKIAIRENRYTDPNGNSAIVFNHDGVREKDLEFLETSDRDIGKDLGGYITKSCFIALPKKSGPVNTDWNSEPVYIYPWPGSNTGGAPGLPGPDENHQKLGKFPTYVYRLGSEARLNNPGKEVLDPYAQYGFTFMIQRAKIDTDGNGILDGADEFSDNLYMINVKIYRSFPMIDDDPDNWGWGTQPPLSVFDPKDEDDFNRRCQPIKEFISLVSM